MNNTNKQKIVEKEFVGKHMIQSKPNNTVLDIITEQIVKSNKKYCLLLRFVMNFERLMLNSAYFGAQLSA